MHLAERLEVVHGLVHGLQRDRRHLGAGPVVQRLDRGVRVVALEQTEDRLALGRDAQAPLPEQIGELVALFMTATPYQQSLSSRQPCTRRGGARPRVLDAAVLLIGEILAQRGAGRARRGRGHARRRRADVRRDRRRGEPGRARAARGSGSGAATGCCGGATPRSKRSRCSPALAKLGAVFAPLNARASVDEARARSPSTPGRACCSRGASHADAGRRARRARRASRSSPSIPIGHATPPPDRRRSTSATRTSSSSRAAAPGGRRASCSRTARTGCARIVGATTHAGRRRHRVHVPAVPHGGLDDRARRLARRAGRCTSCASPTPTTLLRDRRRATARRGCIASPRCGPASSSTASGAYDLSTLVEADTGTSATPPELLHAIKDALPHTVTRVFYGSTEAGPGVQLGDADLFRKPGSVGVAATRRRRAARPTTGEVCLRSPFLMDGYFDDARRDRRRAASTAGTTPATSACSTTRATCRSSAGRATSSAPAARRSRRPRSSRCVAAHPGVAEVAVVGVPDAEWGEVVTAVDRAAARRAAARRRRAPGVLRGPPRAVQAARAASRSSTRSPAPPPPARSSAP